MFTHINPSTNKARLVLAIAIPILVLALSWVSTGQTIHLELLHAWDGFREPLVNQMLEEFMQEHPHIKVTTRLVKTTALEEQFTVTYAGGVAPDVVMLWSKHVIAHATKGSLLPLNDFIEADGISSDIWIPSEITNSEWNGKLYGFPIRTGGEDGNILYYNKQLFSEAGLDAHVPPETWDDLLAYSKRLVRYHGDLLVLNPIMNLDDGATIRPTLNWLYAGAASI